MNKIGFRETTEPIKTLKDGFNYPTLGRNMLMSLNTISDSHDFVNTTTSRFHTRRNSSNNMQAADIDGMYTSKS